MSANFLLHARAVGESHYCEVHAIRAKRMTDFQRSEFEVAMKLLLRATMPDPPPAHEIEVGMAELPMVDDDWQAGGDPGGKLMLPGSG